jgi:hypothetical protein
MLVPNLFGPLSLKAIQCVLMAHPEGERKAFMLYPPSGADTCLPVHLLAAFVAPSEGLHPLWTAEKGCWHFIMICGPEDTHRFEI